MSCAKKQLILLVVCPMKNFILHLLEIDFLTEKEVGIFKRGRNTKTSKRDTKEHRYSTGFECLIGHLYLNEL